MRVQSTSDSVLPPHGDKPNRASSLSLSFLYSLVALQAAINDNTQQQPTVLITSLLSGKKDSSIYHKHATLVTYTIEATSYYLQPCSELFIYIVVLGHNPYQPELRIPGSAY
jgi:hypothetical protein